MWLKDVVRITSSLSVTGAGNFSSNVRITSNSTDNSKLIIGGTTNTTFFGQGTNEDVFIRPGKNAGKVVFDIGNVGIGTSSTANAKLTVKGKVLAEEFEIVTNANQPDYVFDAAYNLRPLSEVEHFIEQNKHLPDVPSAAHAKAHGYKVVEMDNALLRKVEELTLYVIELNKQLEATKAELAEVRGGR